MNMTLASAKAALTKISTMAFDANIGDLSSSDALSLVVDLALETLNPKSKPSALELKAGEVTQFVMDRFELAFAPNDDIAAALNAASILSPQGKEWTRGNISKMMVTVRENIVKEVQSVKAVEAGVTVASVALVVDSAPEVPDEAQEAVLTAAVLPDLGAETLEVKSPTEEVITADIPLETAPVVEQPVSGQDLEDLEDLMADLDNLEVPE